MGKRVWRGRGRPPNSTHSYADRKVLEYLARIAMAHEVDSDQFFNCVVDAWNHRESECEPLVIQCRQKMKDSAVFLFTKAHKVVAQFPIPTTILQAPNQLDRYKQTITTRRTASIHHHDGAHQKIKNLKAGMKQINLQARVLEIPKSKTVHTRFGNTARVSNALIADETGSIRMSLWNQQINAVSKGDMITIKHGKVAKFRGQRQIRIGRYGSLSITE